MVFPLGIFLTVNTLPERNHRSSSKEIISALPCGGIIRSVAPSASRNNRYANPFSLREKNLIFTGKRGFHPHFCLGNRPSPPLQPFYKFDWNILEGRWTLTVFRFPCTNSFCPQGAACPYLEDALPLCRLCRHFPTPWGITLAKRNPLDHRSPFGGETNCMIENGFSF